MSETRKSSHRTVRDPEPIPRSMEGIDPPPPDDDCQLRPVRGASRPGNQNARSHGLYSNSPDRDPEAIEQALRRETRQALKLQDPKALMRIARNWKRFGREEIAWALRMQARKHEDERRRLAGQPVVWRRRYMGTKVLQTLADLAGNNDARAETVRDQIIPEGSESE